MLGVISEWRTEKDLEAAVVAYFKVLSRESSGGTEENQENLSQNSLFLDRDLNPGPPKYETGVLNTRPWRSVFRAKFQYVFLIALMRSKWFAHRIVLYGMIPIIFDESTSYELIVCKTRNSVKN
jgi:hypothetical protein